MARGTHRLAGSRPASPGGVPGASCPAGSRTAAGWPSPAGARSHALRHRGRPCTSASRPSGRRGIRAGDRRLGWSSRVSASGAVRGRGDAGGAQERRGTSRLSPVRRSPASVAPLGGGVTPARGAAASGAPPSPVVSRNADRACTSAPGMVAAIWPTEVQNGMRSAVGNGAASCRAAFRGRVPDVGRP